MNEQKNLFSYLSEWWNDRQTVPQTRRDWSRWLPTPGNVIFTLLVLGLLILIQQVWARPLQSVINTPGPSATTVNYQGRLADSSGTPKDGTFGMTFAFYDADIDGSLVWGPESHAAVPVSEGLFSVGLGSQTSGGIPTSVWNGDRYLEITVGGETLSPRELIRSVPVAGMALTVPDGAIGSDQIIAGTIGTEQIANGAVTQEKAPSMLQGPADNVKTVYGEITLTATESTNHLTGDISFSPSFTGRPYIFLQAINVYTPEVITVLGGTCNGNICGVRARRMDGNNWSAGQAVTIWWVAIGE